MIQAKIPFGRVAAYQIFWGQDPDRTWNCWRLMSKPGDNSWKRSSRAIRIGRAWSGSRPKCTSAAREESPSATWPSTSRGDCPQGSGIARNDTRPRSAQGRSQNIENNPMQSNRRPAWMLRKRVDTSGKSPAFFHHPVISKRPSPRHSGRVRRDCSRKILIHT